MRQAGKMSKPKVQRQFINAMTGQLHLRLAGREGPRPAVLCLHLMPKSGRCFTRLLPELAGDRLAIAPDYPGYGESAPFFSDAKPTVPDYADAIEEVMDHFSLEQADLVGYHTGAMVAVELALRSPDAVRKVVNISAPILSAKEAADFDQQYAAIPLDEAGTRFRTLWARVLQHRGPGMTLEMAAASLVDSLRGGERYEEGHHAAFQHSQAYADALGRMTQPLLVINIGDDLFEHSKRADKLMRNGQRIDRPDWGHGFLDLWPTKAAAMMLQFLDSN